MSGKLNLYRPKTAREVSLEIESLEDFGYNMKDWIHELKRVTSKEDFVVVVAEAPRRVKEVFPGGEIADAYLAAYVDHLCQKSGVSSPEWTQKEDLVLEEPWFAENFEVTRMHLLIYTPSAFKNKNVYTFPEITLGFCERKGGDKAGFWI